MSARELVALVVAVVAALVALVGGDASAYAGTSKTCAPNGWQADGALTRREGRDMATKKTTRRGDSGKGADPTPAALVAETGRAADIRRMVEQIGEVALAGDVGTLRPLVARLVDFVDDGPQRWKERHAAQRAPYVRELAELGPETPGKDEWRGERRRLLKRYLASETDLEYRPSPADFAGYLAAQIHDDEARVPWEPPHPDLTPADFDAGRDLLRAVVEAFGTGDRTTLDLLRPARDLLADLPRTQGERLARYLNTVEDLARRAREEEARANRRVRRHPDERDRLADDLRTLYWLACGGLKHQDRAFASLTPQDLRDRLLACSGKKAGGAGNRGARYVAATLAVSVGAFGSATDPTDFLGDVERFAAQLKTARARSKGQKTA